jgi:hypothetical protein
MKTGRSRSRFQTTCRRLWRSTSTRCRRYPVSDSTADTKPAAEGRGIGTRFAPGQGNKLGKGNSFTRKPAAKRAAVATAAPDDGAAWLTRELSEYALDGAVGAAALILNFCTGKPKSGVDSAAVELVAGAPLWACRLGLPRVELLNLFRACRAPAFRRGLHQCARPPWAPVGSTLNECVFPLVRANCLLKANPVLNTPAGGVALMFTSANAAASLLFKALNRKPRFLCHPRIRCPLD